MPGINDLGENFPQILEPQGLIGKYFIHGELGSVFSGPFPVASNRQRLILAADQRLMVLPSFIAMLSRETIPSWLLLFLHRLLHRRRPGWQADTSASGTADSVSPLRGFPQFPALTRGLHPRLTAKAPLGGSISAVPTELGFFPPAFPAINPWVKAASEFR
jgi:hypothetical protein